jgi:predicted DNA-binding antitoxin AbrB/MazE fold protein
LRPFVDTIYGQKKIIPPPVDFEEGEEFEVEKIVNSRIKRGHLQYLVKWKGFTEDHDEWIDAKTNALHLKDLISEFYSKFPNAEGKRLMIRIPGKSSSGR